MRLRKRLGVLSISLMVIVLTPVVGSAKTDLCGVMKSAEVAKALGPDWKLDSAEPLGGAHTCYGTFLSGAHRRLFGVSLHPSEAATYDAIAESLRSPKQVAGLGDKATLGEAGGSPTLVVSKKGKTYSFGGGPSSEQLQRAAQAILTQLP